MEPESGGGTCRTVQFVSNRCVRPGKGPDERCAIRTDGGPRSYFGSPEETQRERRSVAGERRAWNRNRGAAPVGSYGS